MKSIRVFLIAVILATITLFNFVAALQGYRSSLREAEQLFDNQLRSTAELIAGLYTENTANSVKVSGNTIFQIWQNDTLQAYSKDAPTTTIAPLSPGFGTRNFNGYRWRTAVHYNAQKDHWVIVAERTDLRFTLAENLILESIFPILMGIPIVGLLIWLIVSWGLKPLRNLANELGHKQPDDLSPLTFRTPRRELAQIAHSSNLLLTRLESSLSREKQFASDAAHELRTPISALKVELYNLAQELPEGDESVQRLTTTVDRLGHLVEQILALYRSTPDQYSTTLNALDISALTEEVLANEYSQFEEKAQQLEYDGEPCTLRGDHFALTTLLQNLLSNACKYTPPHGQIRVVVRQDPSRIILTIEDSGSGIPQDQHASVFERFHRLGGDRHNSGERGCGLGLAIVKHIVELHHASISITPSKFETGTAFHVCFPKSQQCLPGPSLASTRVPA